MLFLLAALAAGAASSPARQCLRSVGAVGAWTNANTARVSQRRRLLECRQFALQSGMGLTS